MFTNDNPLNFTDPLGLCFLGLCHVVNAIKIVVKSTVGRAIGVTLAIGARVAGDVQVGADIVIVGCTKIKYCADSVPAAIVVSEFSGVVATGLVCGAAAFGKSKKDCTNSVFLMAITHGTISVPAVRSGQNLGMGWLLNQLTGSNPSAKRVENSIR